MSDITSRMQKFEELQRKMQSRIAEIEARRQRARDMRSTYLAELRELGQAERELFDFGLQVRNAVHGFIHSMPADFREPLRSSPSAMRVRDFEVNAKDISESFGPEPRWRELLEYVRKNLPVFGQEVKEVRRVRALRFGEDF